MRQMKWAALLAAVVLVPRPAHAQRLDRPERVDRGERGERSVHRLMDRLRDEMWDYRRELNFFRRAQEYDRLVDLRYEIRGMAMRVAGLEGRPREQRELARRMGERARDLKRLTRQLERRTDLGAPAEVRRHADRLKDRANRIDEIIDRLYDAVR